MRHWFVHAKYMAQMMDDIPNPETVETILAYTSQCKAKFRELDVDNSGALETDELKQLVDWVWPKMYGKRNKRMSKRQKKKKLALLLRSMDENSDGKMTLIFQFEFPTELCYTLCLSLFLSVCICFFASLPRSSSISIVNTEPTNPDHDCLWESARINVFQLISSVFQSFPQNSHDQGFPEFNPRVFQRLTVGWVTAVWVQVR